MKSKITKAFNSIFLTFNNGVAEMHHQFPIGSRQTTGVTEEAAEAQARRDAKKLQPSVEEGLSLTAPEGYVFAGVAHYSDPRGLAEGFRTPQRGSNQEKKTDARIGKAAWMLYRLSTGMDATFAPVVNDWTNGFASPRGAAARITTKGQLEVLCA